MGISRYKNCRGFSLLELLVVMLIMTLVAGVVMPSYSNAMTNLDLRRSARHVATLLKESRNIAIFQSTTIRFEIDADKRTYGSEMSLQAHQIPADIEMAFARPSESRFDDRTSITFFADGSTSGGVVSVRTEKNSYTIEVDWLTGDVSIQ